MTRSARAVPAPGPPSTEHPELASGADIAKPGQLRPWLRRHWPIAALVGLSLIALLAHTWMYRFLTDDAYISFRYVRNLVDGHGLVFNPGRERVEGYTNFLWVLMLAPPVALGIPIEVAAHALSVAATVALWALVVRETLRWLPGGGRAWLVLIPAWALAATRSVAVWSTSGLETRLFEALLVGAAFRLVREVEALVSGTSLRPWAAVLFALASWTRPDGLLLSGCALGAAGLHLLVRGRFQIGRFAVLIAPFLALVALHFAFRWSYYGEFLPNTYYAKIGGRTWWDGGFRYLAAFALEYALYLWIPLLVAGTLVLVRERRGFYALLVGAMLLPHVLYVAAIGGDHFEYRPLDVIFPFAFLLLFHGARAWTGTPWRSAALSAYLAVLAIGLWQLPYQSHRQMPRFYVAGFPGSVPDLVEAQEFLSPDRDPIYRLPGLRAIAEAHRRLLMRTTHHFAAIRQEEHRQFLATVQPVGRQLRQLVADGLLPRDAYLALPCVGVIPYESDIRTLDRAGLTDAHVAHSPFVTKSHLAHDKAATEEYARSRGVDLWAEVRPVCGITEPDFLKALRKTLSEEQPYLAASIGGGRYLVGRALNGPEHLARRFPQLRFEAMDDSAFLERYGQEAIAQYRERLRVNPDDDDARTQLALVLGSRGRFDQALSLFEEAVARRPGDGYLWMRLGWCYANLGRTSEAVTALEKSIVVARAGGQTQTAADAQTLLQSVIAAGASPAGSPETAGVPPASDDRP